MGTYLVTHKALWLGQQIRNTFYFITSVGEPSDVEWQTIADEIRSEWVAAMQPRLTDNYSFYGVDRRRVDLLGLLTFSEAFTAGAVAGTHSGDNVATQVALLVTNKGTTTKPNRARSYLCGNTESDMTDSIWSSTVLAAAEAFIDDQSALNTGGANPLTRVAAQWNAPHTQVVATNDLSGAASVAHQVPATQRRRRIGVGI